MNHPLQIMVLFLASLSSIGMIAMEQQTGKEKAELQLKQAIRAHDLGALQEVLEKNPLFIQEGYGDVPLAKILWQNFPEEKKYDALNYLAQKQAPAAGFEWVLATVAPSGDIAAFKKVIRLPLLPEKKKQAFAALLRTALDKANFEAIDYILQFEPEALSKIIIPGQYGSYHALVYAWEKLPADKRKSIVEYLLKKGADKTALANALDNAAREGDAATVLWLVKHGVRLTDKDLNAMKELRDEEVLPPEKAKLTQIISILEGK